MPLDPPGASAGPPWGQTHPPPPLLGYFCFFGELGKKSQGEDSRKPIANRANQAIQRARSRALKAVYAKGERTILVEIPNIPKSRHVPPSLDRLKQTGKPKRTNRIVKPSKKHAGSRHRAATSLNRNRTAGVVAGGRIKRLKSALEPENKGAFLTKKAKVEWFRFGLALRA